MRWGIWAPVVLLAPGCSVGTDSVLFVTRTNLAVDLDVEPPTLDVGYKRDEMVLAPIDPQGNVLPVMTTVGVGANPLNFGANHSFATGNAAVILAKYLLADNRPDLGTHIEEFKEFGSDGRPTGRWSAPRGPLAGSTISGERKPYYFGTNTTLGLGVQWNEASVPQSVALGYKRKELAFVPLGTIEVVRPDGTSDDARAIASLLATAHAGTTVGTPEATQALVGQTFATGVAATYLASHPEVRRAVGPSVVPNFREVVDARAEMERIETAKKLQATREDRIAAQEGLVRQIVARHDRDDGRAAMEKAARAEGLGWDPAKKKTLGLVADGEPDTTRKLQAVLDAK